MQLETPYYLIDEQKLVKNLQKIQWLREYAGVKSVLALKCFSTWPVFELMRQYMDGTTSSSLYEARLGYEEFGKEVHAYSVAFSAKDIEALRPYASKIIFNSISQLKRFYPQLQDLPIGLRLNPQISYSGFELADPARQHSRLGVNDLNAVMEVADHIQGAMLHYNCENADFDNFCALLDKISEIYQDLLPQLDWLSLGGGFYFTLEDYPLEQFAQRLKAFSEKFQLQLYLEPGEAAITGSTQLVTQVLDIVHNEVDIAIVDSSIEAHMLDLLVYRETAHIEDDVQGKYAYLIAGKSCLAGDIFGQARFDKPLQVGDEIRMADAGGYTMVKMNWFNGVKMPAIVIKKLDGSKIKTKDFNYEDFKSHLG